MWDFQETFETSKRSFISAFSICMTVPLMFPESNEAKLKSHNFHFQNSVILQTGMDPKGDSMKIHFDNFQVQKWISETINPKK